MRPVKRIIPLIITGYDPTILFSHIQELMKMFPEGFDIMPHSAGDLHFKDFGGMILHGLVVSPETEHSSVVLRG